MAAKGNNRSSEGDLPVAALRMVTQESERRALDIAVLDDEPLIRELLQDNLREQGHQVVCYETSLEILAALPQKRFDVILSDIKMPKMNGMEFYEQVAQQHPAQARRILFLSGDLMNFATRNFLERSGCLYLTKPFRHAALLVKINELVQRAERGEMKAEFDIALPKAA